MKYLLLIVFLLNFNIVQAGRHLIKKDDFTGKTSNVFITDEEEMLANKAFYMILDYREKYNKVTLAAGPIQGSTNCDLRPLLLKDSSGEIHELITIEQGTKSCFARSVDANLVLKPFRVRIPMYSGSDLDIDIDTTNLDLKSLTGIQGN